MMLPDKLQEDAAVHSPHGSGIDWFQNIPRELIESLKTLSHVVFKQTRKVLFQKDYTL